MLLKCKETTCGLNKNLLSNNMTRCGAGAYLGRGGERNRQVHTRIVVHAVKVHDASLQATLVQHGELLDETLLVDVVRTSQHACMSFDEIDSI